MDSDDAAYYDSQINKLPKDETTLVQLLKDQSHIVQATIQNFNDTVTNLNRNEQILGANLRRINNWLQRSGDHQNVLEALQFFDEYFAFLIFLCNQYQTEIATITEAVLLSQAGITHPKIISPAQIVAELSNIMPHLPNDVNLVVPVNLEKAHEIIRLSDLKAYFYAN